MFDSERYVVMLWGLLAAGQSLVPATGDNSDMVVKIMLVVGAICLLAVVAMVVVPKLSKKQESEESEFEDTNEE